MGTWPLESSILRSAVAAAAESEYAGAGLGLPIARGVAEAHGGSLVLESTGPHGSTFTVTLPRAPDLPSDDELPDESAE